MSEINKQVTQEPVSEINKPYKNIFIVPQQFDHSIYTAVMAGFDPLKLIREHDIMNKDISTLNLNYSDKENISILDSFFNNYNLIIIILVIIIIIYLFI